MLNIRGYRLLRCALLLTVATAPSVAFAAPLVPTTKLRLSIVQFVASTGEYRRWDALGGDFDIAADGTINIPALGIIPVGDRSTDQLAADIAMQLKEKLGLLDMPDASLQVVQYPPIYVIGSVMTPGQFEFRPSMTVVQALALAGGEMRASGSSGLTDKIELEANLAGFSSDILRATARLARLTTEYQLAKEIAFPIVLDPADPTTAEIMEQERRIFAAHGNELSRQQAGLEQLAELFNTEIDALEQKLAAIEDQISGAEKQVTTVKGLVALGSATVSRLSDAERIFADLQSDRLDNVIAAMRARENLNQSQRDLAKLEDEQQSETANELQLGQASLEKLTQQQSATRLILFQSLGQHDILQAQTSMTYQILRQADGKPVSIAATEESLLQPGDLVKVVIVSEQPSQDEASAPAALASAADTAQ